MHVLEIVLTLFPMTQYFHSLTYTIDKESIRISSDDFVNTQGRHLLDLCIGSRMRIVNGRHGGDSKGKFTCYTPRGCSVVDYLIVSAELQQRIISFQIAELKSYSDHCPIQFKIEHPFVVQLEKKLSSVPNIDYQVACFGMIKFLLISEGNSRIEPV